MALSTLSPAPLKDLYILDLGCGFGWFARWASEQGAKSVLGIDVSANMLERAKKETQDAKTRYENGDLETLTLEDRKEKYGLVVSQLALHYVSTTGLERLLREVYWALEPGGRFVFSIEHPIFTAPRSFKPLWLETKDGEGKRAWPLEGYAREGERRRNWFVEGVRKWHRTMGTYVRLFLEAGFVIKGLDEWAPTKETEPDWTIDLEDVLDRPIFLLLAVEKPGLGGGV